MGSHKPVYALFTAVYSHSHVDHSEGRIDADRWHRVDEGEETTGLDQSYHGEEAQRLTFNPLTHEKIEARQTLQNGRMREALSEVGVVGKAVSEVKGFGQRHRKSTVEANTTWTSCPRSKRNGPCRRRWRK